MSEKIANVQHELISEETLKKPGFWTKGGNRYNSCNFNVIL